MNVTVHQESLKRLSRYLQNQLQPQAQVIPLQVQCALKDVLMVLVQHPPGNAPNPQTVFATLERSLGTLPPDLAEPLTAALQGSQIKLYMRVLGQQKPYAFHHIPFPDARSPDLDQAMPAAEPSDRRVTNPFTLDAAIASGDTTDPQTVIQPPTSPPAAQAADPAEAMFTPEELANLGLLPDTDATDHALPDPASMAALSTDTRPIDNTTATARPSWRSLTKPLLLTGAGIAGLIILGFGGYALTRPCVIGTCTALESAQTLSQTAAQTLKTGKPEEAAQQATQQLTEAKRLVAEIPSWSGQYSNAQQLQRQLDQVLAADAQAATASQKGQTSDPTAIDWQTTQDLWKQAIAQLEAVPADSPLHAFAQERLSTYRANLAFAKQRITVEQDAQQRLNTARKTADLAIARQNVAQTPTDWQQATVTWQVAMNTLQQIPNGTTAHAEAQQLIDSYRPKLEASRDRATKEQNAQKVYTQAKTYEQQAKAAQQQNQWSAAMMAWQNAIKTAKQVPSGTSISEQAQTLASTYTGFLEQAQTVVKIRGDLDRVCMAAGRICSYTITNDTIQVRLDPSYERKVRTIGGISQFSGDYETMYKVNAHLASLGKALQAVSNNAGIPVQVYNSDRQVIAVFSPQG